MSKWFPRLEEKEGHLYRVLADEIRNAIAIGDLAPGEKLLPHRQMAWKLGVTIATVARAYGLATQWGLLDAQVGHGTHVRNPDHGHGPLTFGDAQERIDLGLLIASPVQDTRLQSMAFDESFDQLGDALLLNSMSAYAPELGYPAHRQAGATWLGGRGIPTESANVVITHGAQEAFLLVLNHFTEAGDTVLVEEFAYLGFRNLCTALKLQMLPVAMDDEGMIVTALEEAATKSTSKLMFICPTLQNPTGVTMGAKRRQAIAEVARRNRLIIIETDPFWHLVDDSPPPVASFAPERTFYISSLSKYASPSIRVAYMNVDDAYVGDIEKTKHALTIGGSSLQAEIATRWIQTGVIHELCTWQQNEIVARSVLARKILGPFFPTGQDARPFLWLSLPEPWRTPDFMDNTRQNGIACIDADRFVVGRTRAPHIVRLALTSPPSRKLLSVALSKIRNILEGSGPAFRHGY